MSGPARARRRAERRARDLSAVFLLVLSLVAASCGGSSSDNAGARRVGVNSLPPGASGTGNANVGMGAPVGVYAEEGAPGVGARIEHDRANAEGYDRIVENPFLEVSRAPLSTFSIDVDTASYSNTRRFINEGQLPPPDAVRVEELINYFTYDYPQPAGDLPFSVNTEVADCPWNPRHRLVQIGLQGRRVSMEDLPPANLVFLVDVSGSMEGPARLPLVKSSLRRLVDQLRPRDRVAVVTYAGSSGLALPSTTGDRRGEIVAALGSLEAGGSTNGGQGLRLAYRVARENFIRGGTNRVILATDGDFNVGVTGDDELVRLVEREREGGVSLSVLGFGMGNLKDSRMEKLADKGNGNYAYIDTQAEADRVFGEQIGGTLFTIARDVKIQVEFNPRRVAGYRLVGYENRLLAAEDFNDDRKDAGEIGAGHTVTALYEVVPAGMKVENPGVDPLKYRQPAQAPPVGRGGEELLTVKLRYKEPDSDQSRPLNVGVLDSAAAAANASDGFKFAAAVAEFGLLLRGSRYKGSATYDEVLRLARASTGADLGGHRAEFIGLVERARSLAASGAGR
ncbi:MAG TPA: VWA domain-containing protein [Pyrinomonadaceae bacterium]|nr:VWA domain-containing protein [Pyrinomonadaceae bacterium]